MPGSTTTVSAHLGPDDFHLVKELRRRAREGDRTLSREVRRTIVAGIAATNDNGGPAKAAEVKTGAGTPDEHQV